MILKFDKQFKNDKYEILFNTESGLEIIRGINGHEDSFKLDMASLLDIGVMGTCKNKCGFCYQGHINKPNMTLSNFKSIIDQSAYHVNQIALGGRGDPNHHENFKEIVQYCRKKNVVPNYTTSGIDLTNNQIEISKMCGAVACSEYGQKHTYEALQKFIDAEIKTNIHYIYSKVTHTSTINILKGIDIWNGKVDLQGLNAIIFLLFKPHGAGKDLDWIPTTKQMIELSTYIFNPKTKFKIGMDSCLANHILKYSAPTKLQRMSIDTCEAARMSAYITPDMKFMPCSFADESIWSIPIENNLHTIWQEGSAFIKFRKTLSLQQNQCPLKL